MLRRIILRLFVTLICLAITAVLFEFYLRTQVSYVVRQQLADRGGILEANPEFLIQYTDRGRRLVPNTAVVIKNHWLSHQDVPVSTNSLGFRDKELAPVLPADERRVLFLGDSITLGDYLPAEEVYVEQMESALNLLSSGTHFQVINAGVGNIGIEDEIQILEESYEKVKPHEVWLAFYLNDSRPPWGFAGEIGDRGWLRRHSILFETIYKNLKLGEWAAEQDPDRFAWIQEKDKLNWVENRDDLLKLAASAKYDWGAAWQEDSWSVVARELDRLKTLGERGGFVSRVVMFPVSFQVEANYVEDAPQRRMQQLAEERHLPYYDVLPLLRKERGKKLFFDQCHPTAEGNRIIGRELASVYLMPPVVR